MSNDLPGSVYKFPKKKKTHFITLFENLHIILLRWKKDGGKNVRTIWTNIQ